MTILFAIVAAIAGIIGTAVAAFVLFWTLAAFATLALMLGIATAIAGLIITVWG